jgi:hypothetical protein
MSQTWQQQKVGFITDNLKKWSIIFGEIMDSNKQLSFIITNVQYPLDFDRRKHFEEIQEALISAQNIWS